METQCGGVVASWYEGREAITSRHLVIRGWAYQQSSVSWCGQSVAERQAYS
jgi:hypothetical protein